MILKIVAYIIFSLDTASASDCLGWFIKSGLAPKTKDCELKCAVTPVDMGTFSCSSSCENLCLKSITEQVLAYAPRLTEGDKVVVSQYPYDAYKVFVAKEQADTLTEQVFKKTRKNDESDAFRHFVWSVLIAKSIGGEKAKIFLNAHEEDSTQTKDEKAMDLKNNEVGLKFYNENIRREKDLDISEIEKEALTKLRRNELTVLESYHKKIPGGYYSN